MPRRINAFALSFLAALWLGHLPAAGGQITQTASIPLTATDWSPGTGGITNPLVFNQFDPKLGTLDAITITFNTRVLNDFELIFYTTPTPTTITVGNAPASNPSEGPALTLYAPNGTTPILVSTVPADQVSRMTATASTYSSQLPITSPYYIPPSDVTNSLTDSLDRSNAAALFQDFIGTGSIGLPVTAIAYSSFTTSSGNGVGKVTTEASASVTLQYLFTAASVPEPSSLILLGLGGSITMLVAGRCRRAAGPARGARD
jgi:PEP-CTERM motif